MQLYLLRHAEAVNRAASDAQRELTDKGIGQARKVGRFCALNGLIPEIVLTSPLRRAEQTARIAVSELGEVSLEVSDFLVSGMVPEIAVKELAAYKNFSSVMIVGHEPDLSSLGTFLLGLPSHEKLHLRKASLTLLDVPAWKPASAMLEFTLPAKFM